MGARQIISIWPPHQGKSLNNEVLEEAVLAEATSPPAILIN